MSRNAQQLIRVVATVVRLTRGRLGVGGMVGLVLLAVLYVTVIQPVAKSGLGIELPTIADANDRSTQVAPPPATRPSDQPSPGTMDPEGLSDLLVEVGRERYRSPAGLVYTRGSAHGHRLKHLMAHAVDVPDRDIHGVFEPADTRTLLLLVDEVYRAALAGQGKAKHAEGRDVFVVGLGRPIGYIGGRAGARRNHPVAQHVRLVVQEDRFITAFPVRE